MSHHKYTCCLLFTKCGKSDVFLTAYVGNGHIRVFSDRTDSRRREYKLISLGDDV